MRVSKLILCFAVTGCTSTVDPLGNPRPDVLRDVEGYVTATCLSSQPQAYLKDQGDAWASVILQRMKGSLDVLADIAEQVKLETAKGDMAVIRDEVGPEMDKALPILYCSEIIDRPAVRAAIQKAATELKPSYEQ